jgi:hypothetical protein
LPDWCHWFSLPCPCGNSLSSMWLRSVMGSSRAGASGSGRDDTSKAGSCCSQRVGEDAQQLDRCLHVQR